MNAKSVQHLIKQAMRLQQQGEFEQAMKIYSSILVSQPQHPDALHLLGLACHQQGDYQTAVGYMRRVVELVPGEAVLRNNFGEALRKSGDLTGAIKQLSHALELRPEYGGAHQNLGSAFADSGDYEAALLHGREAVRLEPARAEAWFNLGLFLLDQVILEDSIQAFRHALTLRPTYTAAANSLLYVLNLLPATDPAEVAEEHHNVASGLFSSVQRIQPAHSQKGRLRIGYVSGDFCAHAVNYFFEPLLEHHDSTHFEIYCYSDVKQPDHVTQRLRKYSENWRDIAGQSDEAVSALVQSDGINILVDLAGYTEHNRLGVFARKPAYIQLSYLGYPNTTGLTTMDFRVVDSYTAPAHEILAGTEAQLRLPVGFACFRPPQHAPAVQPSPVLNNGFTTYGCLHKLEKINSSVIKTWARILRQNPCSRLLLARDQLDDWHQDRLKVQFELLGVKTTQLEMVHLSDPAQSFFQLFARMDVMLDCFPWSGHTLACCALWMGVPVITLQGNTHAGRMVASVLSLLGLEELICGDAESYIRVATSLGQDQDRLSALRETLRERMEHSALRDEAGFVHSFESAYRALDSDLTV